MPMSSVGSVTMFFRHAHGRLSRHRRGRVAGRRTDPRRTARACGRRLRGAGGLALHDPGQHDRARREMGITPSLSKSIQALLDLNYPELEVIVVTERMPEASIEALKKALGARAEGTVLSPDARHCRRAPDLRQRARLAAGARREGAGRPRRRAELRRQLGALPLRRLGVAGRALRSRTRCCA